MGVICRRCLPIDFDLEPVILLLGKSLQQFRPSDPDNLCVQKFDVGSDFAGLARR